jgi:hypothetical protein
VDARCTLPLWAPACAGVTVVVRAAITPRSLPAKSLPRHCEEPQATRQSRASTRRSGLLRYARNDG